MTLIVSEIQHAPGDAGQSWILCAADRRITLKNVEIAQRRKLFKLGRLNATVSYFGLAEIPKGETFEDLMRRLIAKDSYRTVEEFARFLTDHLNSHIPKHLLRNNPSGFHVCGFTKHGVPQFWFIRNIEHLEGIYYKGFKDCYWVTEELSEVHAKALYEPTTSSYREPFGAWFANGDLRSHASAWEMFDRFTTEMDKRGLANAPARAADFERRLQWKMEAIGRYYDIVAVDPIVGGGTDTYILSPDGST